MVSADAGAGTMVIVGSLGSAGSRRAGRTAAVPRTRAAVPRVGGGRGREEPEAVVHAGGGGGVVGHRLAGQLGRDVAEDAID